MQKQEKMKRQGVGFYTDDYAWMEKRAQQRRVSISHIIREVVRAGIETLKRRKVN